MSGNHIESAERDSLCLFEMQSRENARTLLNSAILCSELNFNNDTLAGQPLIAGTGEQCNQTTADLKQKQQVQKLLDEVAALEKLDLEQKTAQIQAQQLRKRQQRLQQEEARLAACLAISARNENNYLASDQPLPLGMSGSRSLTEQPAPTTSMSSAASDLLAAAYLRLSEEEQRAIPGRRHVTPDIASYMAQLRSEFEANGRTKDIVDDATQPPIANGVPSNAAAQDFQTIAYQGLQPGIESAELFERLQIHITKQFLQQHLEQHLEQHQNYMNNHYLRSLLLTQTNVAAVATAAAQAAQARSINYNDVNGNLINLNWKSYPFNRSSFSANHAGAVGFAKNCVFCLNNCEPDAITKSHSIRDSAGRVLCPKLRNYTCPICKATGDYAHTIKYCPKKQSIIMNDLTVKMRVADLNKNQFLVAGSKWSDEIDY